MTQRFKMYSAMLKCAGFIAHTFVLDVERKEDLSTSFLSDTTGGHDAHGFVIFRDRSFVKCPYCEALCHLVPGSAATLDVNFNPSK